MLLTQNKTSNGLPLWQSPTKKKDDFYYDFGTGVKVPTESNELYKTITAKQETPKTETYSLRNSAAPSKTTRQDSIYPDIENEEEEDDFLVGLNAEDREEEAEREKFSMLASTSKRPTFLNAMQTFQTAMKQTSKPKEKVYVQDDEDDFLKGFLSDIQSLVSRPKEEIPTKNVSEDDFLKGFNGETTAEAERIPSLGKEPETNSDSSTIIGEGSRFLPKYEIKPQILPKYEPKPQFLPKHEAKPQFLPGYENPDANHNANAEENYRDANFWDLTVNSAKRGYNNDRLGEELYKKMLGQKNEAEKYKKILAGEEYNFEPNGWFNKRLSEKSERFGEAAQRINDPKALATLAAGAFARGLTAAVAGQAGPQAALPEEIITVPASVVAGVTTAYKATEAANAFRIEAGHFYDEMVSSGVSENVARALALAVGGANAGLELLPADEIIKSMKILNKRGDKKELIEKIEGVLLNYGFDDVKNKAQDIISDGVGKIAYQTRE